MPTIKRQFVHDDIVQGTKVTLYHHNDYNDTLATINSNNLNVYQEYNTVFFQDLFELLSETNLLESYELINNTETYYQQTMTIFGCKFCVWLNDNVFAMIKDYITMSNTNTIDTYYNAWVSYGTPISINDYTITVNYNTTFVDVTVNYGNSETLPLFTLIKCHSIDNTYNFVYASKNCNGVAACFRSIEVSADSSASTWDPGYYNGTNAQPSQVYTQVSNLTGYYHHIYYCDVHKIQSVLFNKIIAVNNENYAIYRHSSLTGNAITTSNHLFMRYRTSEIFNINFNGIKVMKPIACHFNIVFDDIDEVLLGPQDTLVLCPGRYYNINDVQYFVPGCDEIVRGIKTVGELVYNITSLRFFLKI